MGVFGRISDRIRLWLLLRDEYESLPLRKRFRDKHEIDVGLYSYGCFDAVRISARTRIGRYCSIAYTARIANANHPLQALSTHPYLYAAVFGVLAKDQLDPAWLVIGDDVWIGNNATISPGCKAIGRGAVIGAGAVVTHDVAPYSIVAGVPARPLRMRFAPDVIAAIEQSRWWEMDKQQLARAVERMPDAILRPDAQSLRGLRG